MTGGGDGNAEVFLDGAEDGGFEAGEGKVEVGHFGVGEGVFFWVTGFGGFTDGGAAGVGKTEDFGDFVEAFADGVVVGGADNLEVVVVFHVD